VESEPNPERQIRIKIRNLPIILQQSLTERYNAYYCRVAGRGYYGAGDSYRDIGFRVCVPAGQ